MLSRPKDIERFGWIQLGIMVTGFINTLMNWDDLLAMMQNSPTFLASMLAISYGITFLLLYLIVMRRNNVARWILVILAGLSALMTVPTLLSNGMSIPGGQIMPLLFALANIISFWFLFTPAARQWFAGKTDPDLFA